MKTYNCKQAPFKVFGIPTFEKEKTFYRLPESVTDKLENLKTLGKRTPGARVGFKTDATSFTVRLKLKTLSVDTGMSLFACQSISVMIGDRKTSLFQGLVNPANYEQLVMEKTFSKSDKMEEVTLWLPRNEEIEDVEIDLPENANILPPSPYKYGPVLFYGSSITEGGCCTNVTNNYIALLSRWLDMDFYNFGFSGSAKAETEMGDFLKTIDCKVFVYDYDHNASTPKDLQETHERFFKQIRDAHPSLPILMMSRPNFYDTDECRKRREIIKQTYLNAKNNGDENIYFIDGETFFGEEDRTLCTVDTIHPNDLGFYRMAKAIRPVLENILKG